MDQKLLQDYQKALIYAGLDDFTPNAVLSSTFGGVYGNQVEQWKSVVIDFIYRNMTCGLLEVSPVQTKCKDATPQDVRTLLSSVDLDDIATSVIWVATYFDGTKKLDELLSSFCLKDWIHLNDSPNLLFQNTLLEIYQENGVPL